MKLTNVLKLEQADPSEPYDINQVNRNLAKIDAITEVGRSGGKDYIKHANGSLVCVMEIIIDMNIKGYQQFTYPIEFIDSVVSLTVTPYYEKNNGSATQEQYLDAVSDIQALGSTGYGGAIVIRNKNIVAGAKIVIRAEGKWK